ncbi:MAG TPA: nitroreductase/quinone reductase family protein [Anaerolineales bacterium]
MPPIRYSYFHAMIQKAASSAAGAWFLGRVLRYLDRITLLLSGGRLTLTTTLAGLPVVMVTTTGAHTGQPHTQPLAPIRDPRAPGRFALIASNWGQHRTPAWYYNLRKNPRASCTMDRQTSTYVAREASGEEYDRFWTCATETYIGFHLYQQRAGRRIPIMVMEREDS